MRRLALAALLLALAGCGAGTRTVTVTNGAGGSTSTPSTGVQSCSTINAATLPSGSRCSAGGVTETIEHQPSAVHLQTLTARVVGVSTAATLSGTIGSVTALGRFVVISVAITNDADSPESFDRPGAAQTAVVANRTNYSEDFEAENGPDPRSCLSAANSPIQPGETATCDVVYDMPVAAVDRARSKGLGLAVANFGDSLTAASPTAVTALGVILVGPLANA